MVGVKAALPSPARSRQGNAGKQANDKGDQHENNHMFD
jgi:hypothetical protein